MARIPMTRVQGRAAFVLSALVLYAVVFVGRFASHDPANGLAFLYLLPIVVIAIEFGLRPAMGAVALAVGLVFLWDGLADADIGVLGFVVRGVVFVSVGALCAQMADRARRITEASDRFFELSSDLVCTADLNGYFTRLNGRWEETLGWSRDELMSKPFVEFVHPADRERTEQESARIADSGEPTISFSNCLGVKGGGWRQIEWSSKLDTANGVIYASARDVTDRHRAEQARLEAEERFRVAFQDSSAGMALVGLAGSDTGRILETNSELAQILGVPREDLIGAFSLTEFAHPDDLPALVDGMKRLAAGETSVLHAEVRIVRPDDEARWVDLTTSIVRAEDGTPQYRLSQLYDIESRKQTEQRLRHMADHDPLSWLFNHRRFMADLTEELASSAVTGSQGAVMLIDLDHFKEVNDIAGHAVGDEVIKTIGLALVRRLRSGDVAGRLGGDEFAVLLRRVEAEQAILVAHDLLAVVGEALAELASEQARAVTLSIGVAMIDADSPVLAGDLMTEADGAMYDAKRAGGDRVALTMTRRSEREARAAAAPRARSLVAGPHPR